MSSSELTPLTQEKTQDLPFGSELMLLPDRIPVLFNLSSGKFESLSKNPFDESEDIFPVAAFNSPGYVVSNVSAYEERPAASFLPLFSYGGVGLSGDSFRSSVVLIDSEKRQDLREMPEEKVRSGAKELKKLMKDNRLREHITKCALDYGCPAAKNFFLGRFEAPLPTSKSCNARCLGCISLQDNSEIPHCQNRIVFTPTPSEIAEVALYHINRVKNSVVSFGQGCEGDPLMATDVIIPAIKMIREKTDTGTINMNTNASIPSKIEELFDAGLDSIRVSMNSVREDCYNAYYRPKGYTFKDVLESISVAGKKGFVSINYLNSPGVTDSTDEVDTLFNLLSKDSINQIQWRNLNYDPLRYWESMGTCKDSIGMDNLIEKIKKNFPKLTHGYFNPPKERFKG
ncbi:MAG: radical SAM protein [Deltaproteobacteria bacterium]|nr:radical SAM protein [Deltaproteobacteria bacterium]